MIKHRAILWTMVAILLMATAVRLFRIETQSIWFDEGWSAYAASQPSLLAAAQADLTNPPLYYMILHIAASLFGLSEFALRWVSTLFCLLTIVLVYHLTAGLFGRRAGGYAALPAACLPLLWWASQEARMYTLLAFLVTVCALAWHKLLRSPSRWAWSALLLAELALLYAHNTGPIAAIWLNVVTLIAWLSRRSLRRPDWRMWIVEQGIVGLAFAPWFVNYYLRLADANSAVTNAPVISLTFLANLWQAFFAGPWSLVNQNGVLIGLSALAFLVFLFLTPWRSANAGWLVLHAVLLTAGVVAGLILLGNEMHGRYLAMVAPLVVVPLGAGIAHVHWRWLRYIVITLFLALFVIVMALAQNPLYQHDDARSMVRYYAQTLTDADTVVAWSYADRYELAYYWDRLGVAAQRVTLPEGADAQAVLPLLPQEGRIARNIWYTQRADYRGMLACVLANDTVDLPETFTVSGMTSELYGDPGRDLPEMRQADVEFGIAGQSIAKLISYGEIGPGSPSAARCVPLTLVLDQPTLVPLKATLIVRNEFGWEIARADATFAQADQQTSDQRLSGYYLTAFPLLRLPYGTPPGDYQVLLRIYDESLPSGYEPMVSRANITSGRDLVLATWRAQETPNWESTNRISDLPFHLDRAFGESARLIAHDLPSELPARRNGDTIAMTLLWDAKTPPPALTLRDTAGRWTMPVETTLARANGIVLDWREAHIPSDAPAGMAELILPDGMVLARQPIE
ncbi:MAG: glycosyltransferase family 39 protein, partial [Anaerolineae bacterium]|nr:glycosyltransferase family 39 protein [Anaerolineae bacterium]